MSMKYKIGMIIGMLFLILISACERPASKAPIAKPESGEAIVTPLPIDQQILNATMTAQAIMKEFNQPTSGSDADNKDEPQQTDQEETQIPTAIMTEEFTPTALPPTPELTKPDVYTVKQGEFPFCLARRFDVDPDDLLSLNGLSGAPAPGTELKIPQSGSFPAENRALLDHPDTWTVSAGETIYQIACAYGDVYPEAIIAVNGLVEPYDLTAGQILQIP